MRKVWHPYWTWEDWKAGMWRRVSAQEERDLLPVAQAFTGNHVLYGSHMMRVIVEWPISCEHNLTDHSLNKQAWIGHAACALAHALPETVVRRAWGMLTDEQRNLANDQADIAVKSWRSQYRRRLNVEQAHFAF